jgi:hypothetical protein
MAKAIAKKTAAKKKANGKTPTTNPLHEKLIKLFIKPNGATLAELVDSG